MSKGIEIAAARFAAGEINEEEYKRILAALGAKPTTPTPAGGAGKANWQNWVGGAIGVALVVMVLRGLSGGDAGGAPVGLHVNNLRSDGLFGDLITGQILNEGSGSDVWFWIEVGGTKYCPRRVYIPANGAYNFQMNCYDMINDSSGGGRFSAKVTRSPNDWLLSQATSL